MNMKPVEFYTPEDFSCGGTVTIYGREMLIYDADEFTK